MTQRVGDTGGKQRDCIVQCEACGSFFPGWIDVDDNVYALGPPENQCCTGYSLREVKATGIDEFADS